MNTGYYQWDVALITMRKKKKKVLEKGYNMDVQNWQLFQLKYCHYGKVIIRTKAEAQVIELLVHFNVPQSYF